ncbi:MAG TPA: hypothetical protein VMU19_07430, partial [Bryobacteraceae bacterium]|nr:hypothetical protein [Bryobacteraceae bacterium]
AASHYHRRLSIQGKKSFVRHDKDGISPAVMRSLIRNNEEASPRTIFKREPAPAPGRERVRVPRK